MQARWLRIFVLVALFHAPTNELLASPLVQGTDVGVELQPQRPDPTAPLQYLTLRVDRIERNSTNAILHLSMRHAEDSSETRLSFRNIWDAILIDNNGNQYESRSTQTTPERGDALPGGVV